MRAPVSLAIFSYALAQAWFENSIAYKTLFEITVGTYEGIHHKPVESEEVRPLDMADYFRIGYLD